MKGKWKRLSLEIKALVLFCAVFSVALVAWATFRGDLARHAGIFYDYGTPTATTTIDGHLDVASSLTLMDATVYGVLDTTVDGAILMESRDTASSYTIIGMYAARVSIAGGASSATISSVGSDSNDIIVITRIDDVVGGGGTVPDLYAKPEGLEIDICTSPATNLDEAQSVQVLVINVQ